MLRDQGGGCRVVCVEAKQKNRNRNSSTQVNVNVKVIGQSHPSHQRRGRALVLSVPHSILSAAAPALSAGQVNHKEIAEPEDL